MKKNKVNPCKVPLIFGRGAVISVSNAASYAASDLPIFWETGVIVLAVDINDAAKSFCCSTNCFKKAVFNEFVAELRLVDSNICWKTLFIVGLENPSSMGDRYSPISILVQKACCRTYHNHPVLHFPVFTFLTSSIGKRALCQYLASRSTLV